MSSLGLSPETLKAVFPYHIAVNERFCIVQIGDKLSELLVHKKLLGSRICNHFIFKGASPMGWCWNDLMSIGDSSVELSLRTELCNYRKSYVNLTLKGKMLVLPVSSSNEAKGLFLLDLLVTQLKDLESYGLKIEDLSPYGCTRELLTVGMSAYSSSYCFTIFITGEHLHAEMALTRLLEEKVVSLQAKLDDESDARVKVCSFLLLKYADLIGGFASKCWT
jgi:hypothetical protein